MAENAIIVQDLAYHYGQLKAVNNISFTVAQGEIIGFLGPNGAGKTTTVKMLTGLLRPKSGKAVLLGFDIAKEPEKVQAQIGVCFEENNLYQQMSAEANLKLFARLFGVKDFDAKGLLKKIGLEGRERDRVQNFSKGMKQRLMVARAMVSRPKILFLDEPTDGLDPTSAENIRRIILEEKARGVTIFLTTHDMMEADKLADRVAFINQGEIVALDTPHNLKQQYGKRLIKAGILTSGNKLEYREIEMDSPQTPEDMQSLFGSEKVVTIHSEEASLEDIFIRITGRGLIG